MAKKKRKPESRGQERDRRTGEDVTRADIRKEEDESRNDKRYLEDMLASDLVRSELLGITARPSFFQQMRAGLAQGLVIATIVIGLAFGGNALLGPSPLEQRVDRNAARTLTVVRSNADQLKESIKLNRKLLRGLACIVRVSVRDAGTDALRSCERRFDLPKHAPIKGGDNESQKSDSSQPGPQSTPRSSGAEDQPEKPKPKPEPDPTPEPSPSPSPTCVDLIITEVCP